MTEIGTLLFIYYFTGLGFALHSQSAAYRGGTMVPFPLGRLLRRIFGWPWYAWDDFREAEVQRRFIKSRNPDGVTVFAFTVESAEPLEGTYASWLSTYLLDLVELVEERSGRVPADTLRMHSRRLPRKGGGYKAQVHLITAEKEHLPDLRWVINTVIGEQHG